MIERTGEIIEIIYRNEETGYTVAVLETDDTYFTIVGTFPFLKEEMPIRVSGDMIKHPKFGEQLRVDHYEEVPPTDVDGILKYLGSGLIPGIGTKTAKRIVDAFGEETLDILQYNPERLKSVDGIGHKKAETIATAFQEQRGIREIMLFLQNYGIGVANCLKIYKAYGNDAVKKVKNNPYMLAKDVKGIGFVKADRIATSLGIDPNSSFRIHAGVLYSLEQLTNQGHTYAPKNMLVRQAKRLLGAEILPIENTILEMAANRELKVVAGGEEDQVYLPAYFAAEAFSAQALITLATKNIDRDEEMLKARIQSVQDQKKIDLALTQQKAIHTALTSAVTVITGGPGTGKTTTINTILDLAEDHDLDILLAAPTGRAAKRMAEATGRESKTIHRLLEYGRSEGGEGLNFGRDEDNPLEGDLIIIDEASMIDILLFYYLLRAVPPEAQVILVGDVDQLPSVGAGNVLRDVIESGVVPVVRLTEVFRQAQESMIVVNAHKINQGMEPEMNQKEKDFFFIRENHDQVLNTVVDLVVNRLPKWKGFDPYQEIQVLTATRKRGVGVLPLNEALQAAMNPTGANKPEIELGTITFRLGDRVMQTRNNYQVEWKRKVDGVYSGQGEGVFNGDFGRITGVNVKDKQVTVLFDEEKEILYEYNQLEEITLAYAITIHKSQGSEFPVVVIPLSSLPPMLETRNLIYTAITRAKQLVVLVGQTRVLERMIQNNQTEKRYSGLKQKLQKAAEYLMD
ncbi:ATP-dependent RecD-like DNA helicase [Gottschalkiaceae bacterium SANA]|nr:ATP-dependent RecD-like DNA helicase [Gottschalkiaceae bacterium SANA]